jgi:hypothetical protein
MFERKLGLGWLTRATVKRFLRGDSAAHFSCGFSRIEIFPECVEFPPGSRY